MGPLYGILKRKFNPKNRKFYQSVKIPHKEYGVKEDYEGESKGFCVMHYFSLAFFSYLGYIVKKDRGAYG